MAELGLFLLYYTYIFFSQFHILFQIKISRNESFDALSQEQELMVYCVIQNKFLLCRFHMKLHIKVFCSFHIYLLIHKEAYKAFIKINCISRVKFIDRNVSHSMGRFV